jgi:sigma-B regulation protein RsbU (phosphoserine phosphatase)
MVMIRAILHLVTNTDKDASTILNWVNRGITGKIDIDHFATLQILIYNPLTGDCEFANAGHRHPLVWREATGLVDAIEMQSVPIGVEKNTEYASTHFKLDDGDIILLYTDGVVEMINQAGRQYGVKSLTTMLHKFHELSPKDIAAKINADVHAFGGNARQHDDQTLLAMKAKL